MEKKFILISGIILIALIFPCKHAFASKMTQRDILMQRIEILKQKLEVLKSMIFYSKSQQAEINAPAYLAVNLIDGSTVVQKNIDAAYPIASVTKLMNAVVAIENIAPKSKIKLTSQTLQSFGHSPVLFEGLEVSFEDLLKASLIQSVNDAAESISYFAGRDNFIGLMNKKAKELGMNNTVYYDACGLDPQNRSTAGDLAKLISYVYSKHPELLAITKNDDFWMADREGNMLKFSNMNNFYLLDEFIGGKTGYLPEAKQTFASVFNVNGKPYAISLLHSANRMADIFAIIREISK